MHADFTPRRRAREGRWILDMLFALHRVLGVRP